MAGRCFIADEERGGGAGCGRTRGTMITKTVVAAAVAIVAGTAWLWSGSAGLVVSQSEKAPRAAAVPVGTESYRGLAIQVASGYKPVETYGPLLKEIAGLGANAVLLSVAGHMEHATAQSIFIEARKVPAPEEFKAIIRQARDLHLRTIIMPIVLLRDPRGSEWRGVIEPPDWDDWWQQYTEFILYFADIARDGQADALMVGSELISTEKYT
jgi:hypothetical protein